MKNEDDNLSTTLHQNATLVRLTAKHPSGIKVNKELRSKLAEEHGMELEMIFITD
jgi:hypothetical protein